MRNVWKIVALVVLFTAPSPAGADPLRVQSGGLFLDHEGEQLRLAGEGFNITQSFSPLNINYGLDISKQWRGNCLLGEGGCAGGETLDVSFRTPGDVYLGVVNATIGGKSYSNVELRGRMEFDVQKTQLTPTTDTGLLSQVLPFLFSGRLKGFAGGKQVFVLSLAGSGIAGVPMYFDPGLGRFNGEEGYVGYSFANAAATPEPGTWLLLATGAAALAARRKRRQA